MRVGVTGHQRRDGLDWGWTRDALRTELERLGPAIEGWSALAAGTDQLFAQTVLDLGGSLVTVVPGPWYPETLEGDDLVRYDRLLPRGKVIELSGLEGEDAYLAAGLRVADSTDALVAVWDGQPAQGRGGTADIVDHARGHGGPVIHLDPIRRVVRRLGPGMDEVATGPHDTRPPA